MIRLKDGVQSTDAFLKNAIGIAEYYGFTALDSIARKPPPPNNAKNTEAMAKAENDISFARRDERALPGAARKLLARINPRDTLLAWRVASNTGTCPSVSLELHILGTSSTIAEALLIIVANAIASQAGAEEERVVLINNIGSSESSGRYIRDVGLYLRKHIESISPTLRPRAAIDPLGTLVQLIECGHPAVPRAPQAMEYLTEEERSRFWEILEYLESAGLPYELNPHILGSRDCWSHSLFEISQIDSATGLRVPVAFGGRYDPLMSRFARTPRSAAMVAISCEVTGTAKSKSKPLKGAGTAAPMIYLTHLGNLARQRALGVLENLRKADIHVHHSLWHDRITEQMERANAFGTPYILILGHKEVTEGTIIVREVATNSQATVPIDDLASYLKRHRSIVRPKALA